LLADPPSNETIDVFYIKRFSERCPGLDGYELVAASNLGRK